FTTEQIKTAFLASPEYFHNRGQNTNPGFVTALYDDILNRAPDPTGATDWGSLLASGHAPGGADPRTFVAYSFVTSPEGSQDLVRGYYQLFLNRPADLAGLTGWAGLIENGTGSGAVVAGIVASDEYFQRAIASVPASTLAEGNNFLTQSAVTV